MTTKRQVGTTMKSKSFFTVIRHPVLPEDEGRTHTIGYFETIEEAEQAIDEYSDDYFHRSDFQILKCEPTNQYQTRKKISVGALR